MGVDGLRLQSVVNALVYGFFLNLYFQALELFCIKDTQLGICFLGFVLVNVFITIVITGSFLRCQLDACVMNDWIFYADSVMLTTFTSPIRASLTFMFSQGLLLTFSQPGCLEMHGEQFAVLEKFLLDKYLKFTKLICLLSMLNLLVWMFWLGQLQSKFQRGVWEIFIPARLQGKVCLPRKKTCQF